MKYLLHVPDEQNPLQPKMSPSQSSEASGLFLAVVLLPKIAAKEFASWKTWERMWNSSRSTRFADKTYMKLVASCRVSIPSEQAACLQSRATAVSRADSFVYVQS